MQLFNDDGHFTDEALKAVIDGSLDELNRLEAAEHLSYCDECLMRYTDMLSDDELMTPSKPLVPKQRIREKGVQIFLNRYLPAAMAAVFAFVLWGTGVFGAITDTQGFQKRQEKRVENRTSIMQKADEAMKYLDSALLNIIDTVTMQNQTKPHA
ncbi:MAG: hypothetical protein EOM30_11095 [Clostridia bacterium]|nr:hypothetical protein [Clostridia bacterium]NLS84346.1 hypothetical protein [Oscillospiraceae bacterium]